MNDKVRLKFLGAAGTVTGSKIYLEFQNFKILIDCGMFQGLKELRILNREELPINVSELNYVLLTHGHLDHTGYLPKLIQQGFTGKILGTSPTLAITEIILRDTAKIQEEEAKNANEESYTKHHPAVPNYTLEDVEKTLLLFEHIKTDEWINLFEQIKCRFIKAGHILGASSIELNICDSIFVFSGDLGRTEDLLLEPPEVPRWADHLFIESTYGNKLHPEENVEKILSDLIKRCIQDHGILLIASFAVERLQLLIYLLFKIFRKNAAPQTPVFIDSPMGVDATHLFSKFQDYHKLPANEFEMIRNQFELVSSFRRTWEIIDMNFPRIVIAGSGMLTGGRILAYLKQFIDDPSTILLLTGYQAEGTRGRQILDGVHEIKIYGKYFPVKASIEKLESLSAHADQSELVEWCSKIKNVPENVFLVHGEKQVTDAFRVKLETVFNWNIYQPHLDEEIEIEV
ncbi:MBL fold metallo-hydrolase [Christiangramia sp. SM2212]|uniref:MBL fold metallo-hydrolase n=1 Tax=Christiangramia sediminicola TaxID=3073267 RepID=A0ABU1END2_9FLAO|nr:MBL fold metallo-hydrolase [Christiangramia sp. SM2212]MDR5589900.1 MBL fold metallo-hydrolase [Christiangramia sp. SM2212]